MKCCVAAILSVLLARTVAAPSDTVVQIQEGSLRGTTLTSPRNNRTFFAFMGIPYAKSPVQNLRFMAPQLPESWNGTRDAVVEGSVCPQKNPYTYEYEGDEDCLFLNVYTPQLPSKLGQSLKAVMVWIHGGGWHFSSGNRNVNGPDYFMDEDIVIVTMNYRLGALGFLSLPTANVSGNNGLKDQVMALRWIRQNIVQFGGDPDKVTIFGASAGGSSVHYHMLSPMSRGLFHRAISQSGTALNAWAFNEPETNHNYSHGLAELLGHNYTDCYELIELLRTETPERIVNFTFTLGEQGHGIPFHPTTDSSEYDGEIFLPDTPGRLIKAGRLNKVPYIAGINSREGIWEVSEIKKALAKNSVHLEDIPAELGIEMDRTKTTEVAAEIQRLYFGNKSVSESSVDQHIELSGDLFIVAGVYLAARKLSLLSATPVYFYEFSYSGGMSIFKSLVGGDEISGSCHLDDTAYLFRFARLNKTFDSETSEWKTSRRIVRLWANFAKAGNPTQEPEPLLQNVVWAPVTGSDFCYLSIGTDLALRHNFNKDRMDFWEAVLQYNSSDS